MSDDNTPNGNEYMGGPDPDDNQEHPDWDAEKNLEFLVMEKSVNPDEKDEDLALRLLREAAPQAATRLIHLALHSSNDNTSMNSSKYILDFLREGNGDMAAKWERLVGDVVSEAELTANQFPSS